MSFSRVYLIPGYLSSELYLDSGLTSKIWINRDRQAFGQLVYMQLAPDGINPGGPNGKLCYIGGAILAPWLDVRDALAQQMGQNYAVMAYSWDWRTEIFAAGTLLATRLMARESAANPCTLVGHSTGGLVALSAWAVLQAAGQSALVRRIVTLGTPQWGCYYPPAVLNDVNTGEKELLSWNETLLNVAPPLLLDADFFVLSLNRICQVFGSFPSFYELFPFLGSPDAAGDPYRAQLYDAANWPASRGVSQAWLDYARLSFQPVILDPLNQPPSWILTAVAGQGQPTYSGLYAPSPLVSPSVLRTTSDGDGIVTSASAWGAAEYRYAVLVQHSSIPSAVSASGQLAAWILDPRSAPTPPPVIPPPSVSIPPIITPPPASVYLGGSADPCPPGRPCCC